MSGGMHLLPMYYTTTSQKKRKAKKVTVKMQSALDAHQKYLKKVGYKGSQPLKGVKAPSFTPARQAPNYPSLSNDIGGVAPKKEAPLYTGNAVIGQAYNKGGLQVLTTKEANDPETGKRR